MNIINKELSIYGLGRTDIEVLIDDSKDKVQYDEKRQVFNRRFDFRPWAIVSPTNNLEVSLMVRLAKASNRELRVRGGGHDHEGECSATDALVLDMRKMKSFGLTNNLGTTVANIGVGWVFKDLIVPLEKAGMSIPHGTCQTVGITGFTLGGGWGPWTRKYGMCCEHLVGATIILGDGTIKHLSEGSDDPKDQDLLWALRGGGGFSYGILTELKIKTFPIPENAHKFEAVWRSDSNVPALNVLAGWEEAIAPESDANLVGTNLQIIAKPEDNTPIEESVHECHFFGYYIGSKDEINTALAQWFKGAEPDHIEIIEDSENSHLHFSAWGRILHSKNDSSRFLASIELDSATEFPLEEDIPAPHKLTSRLVNKDGLGDAGRKRLIKTLESNLLSKEGAKLGVMTYVTLGAISGPFYKDYAENKLPTGAAFPFQDRPYTIQYQAWWDTNDNISPEESEMAGVNLHTNRAMDWIETCRAADFPETSGAFISFKDSSVPTASYFMQNYERLMKIKMNCSEDPTNRFRSRKTIL